LTYFGRGGDRVVAAEAAQRKVTVCILDELDFLLTKDFQVLYNFYSWPLEANSTFVLVGIANTMDLPERLSIRLVCCVVFVVWAM
jgi:origin recognition complex subunit 1